MTQGTRLRSRTLGYEKQRLRRKDVEVRCHASSRRDVTGRFTPGPSPSGRRKVAGMLRMPSAHLRSVSQRARPISRNALASGSRVSPTERAAPRDRRRFEQGQNCRHAPIVGFFRPSGLPAGHVAAAKNFAIQMPATNESPSA